MGSLGKVYERILLFAVCLAGPALFFLHYRSIQKQLLAFELSRDFTESVASRGSLGAQDYELFLEGLAKIGDLGAEITDTTYHREPVYGFYGRAAVSDYFSSRNVRDTHYHRTEAPGVDDADPSALRMQTRTNATVLASLMDEGLPLGDGSAHGAYSYEAVVPEQEIYEGEHLATVVRVDTGDGVYFAVGDGMVPVSSGIYTIRINGVPTAAAVRATVWPRTVTCASCGNGYTCTKEVVGRYRATGRWEFCPYCASLVRDIIADVPQVTVPVGTAEAGITGVSFTVVYYNGVEETLPLSALSNNYSASYAGMQDVSVSYKGFSKECAVRVVTLCPECRECGNRITGRNAFDCGLYPYCPECMEARPVFLGECATVPETFSSGRLVETMLDGKKCVFGRGDYFSVTVSRGGRASGGNFSFLSPDRDVYFRAGRRVRRAVPK